MKTWVTTTLAASATVVIGAAIPAGALYLSAQNTYKPQTTSEVTTDTPSSNGPSSASETIVVQMPKKVAAPTSAAAPTTTAPAPVKQQAQVAAIDTPSDSPSPSASQVQIGPALPSFPAPAAPTASSTCQYQEYGRC